MWGKCRLSTGPVDRAALMKLHTHVKSYKLEDSRFPATPLFVKELALHLFS